MISIGKAIQPTDFRVFYSPAHADHAPLTYSRNGVSARFKDVPARVVSMLSVVEQMGLPVEAPAVCADECVLTLHSPEYLHFLETAYVRWQELVAGQGGSELACADRYAVRGYQSGLPRSIQGQVGYYLSGSAVPLSATTWPAARAAVDTAIAGAEALLAGGRAAYALCRPPGHHAYRDLAGGYCYLNNAALAAAHLRKGFARVAIIDVDVHHGNGTQWHFYGRDDVFFASIHADPNDAYPFYSGYAEERGKGAGEGFNLNLPLPVGTADEAYRPALLEAVGAVDGYAPDAIVVSLGLDAHRDDPQGLFALSTDAFGWIGETLSALGRPTLLVQEGGYGVGDVGRSLACFLNGFGVGAKI